MSATVSTNDDLTDLRERLIAHARAHDLLFVRFVARERAHLVECCATGHVAGLQPASVLVSIGRGSVTVIRLSDVRAVEVIAVREPRGKEPTG